MNLYCKYYRKIVGIEKKKKQKHVQTKRYRKIIPSKRIASSSDDKKWPGPSKKQNKKVLRRKRQNENIWQCGDCADEWDEDGDDCDG